jgi:hypothetical protein
VGHLITAPALQVLRQLSVTEPQKKALEDQVRANPNEPALSIRLQMAIGQINQLTTKKTDIEKKYERLQEQVKQLQVQHQVRQAWALVKHRMNKRPQGCVRVWGGRTPNEQPAQIAFAGTGCDHQSGPECGGGRGNVAGCSWRGAPTGGAQASPQGAREALAQDGLGPEHDIYAAGVVLVEAQIRVMHRDGLQRVV